jgi:hypothetical protein
VKYESTDRKKDNEYIELREIMNIPMKMMMNTHQSRNCSEPSILETPK